jgi:hypothetical protein
VPYVEVILGQFFPKFIEEERLYGCFQQGSATAQTERITYVGFAQCLLGQIYQQWYFDSTFT